MNEHRNKIFITSITALILFCMVLSSGCDVFEQDGAENGDVVSKGYFYMFDRETAHLVMLNSDLKELKRWDVSNILPDSSMQGITFDGNYLWFSSAAATDQIIQVDATEDTLIKVKSFDAPPQKHGTVRDIASDGVNLWALNSGSVGFSLPPTLYKLNPADGSIIGEFILPSNDPRALMYVRPFTDVYGRLVPGGITYTDLTTKKLYRFLDIPGFDTVFTVPNVPRGASYTSPVGLTHDGTYYWVVNSSSSTNADHLYRLSYTGHEESRYDLPYSEPGAIVYSKVDVRIPAPPVVLAISPASGALGETLPVDLYGSGFKAGGGLTMSMGSGVHVDSIQFISTAQIRATITIDSNAVTGKRNVTVTNPGGRSVTVDSIFTVTLVPIIPHLWLVEQDLDSLYQIRISDTTVLQRWDTRGIAPGGSPQGLAFDGTNIWLCASGTDRRIYKMNTSGATLSAISSIPGPTSSGTLRGIVWESGSLWVTVSTVGRIYRVDPSSGAVQDSVNTPGIEPRGIVFVNGKLYCNDTSLDSVYEYQTSSGLWKGIFATPTPSGGTTGNRFATGMTWDGSNFWIANSTGNFDHVYKVTPAGVVLQYFASPRVGPAQVTGITYTPY